MDKRRLRATREVYYASKTRHEGEEFEADASDAKLLVGLEKAVYAEDKTPEPPPAPKKLEIRDMRAAEEPTAPAEEEPQRPRRYRRRDMRADE